MRSPGYALARHVILAVLNGSARHELRPIVSCLGRRIDTRPRETRRAVPARHCAARAWPVLAHWPTIGAAIESTSDVCARVEVYRWHDPHPPLSSYPWRPSERTFAAPSRRRPPRARQSSPRLNSPGLSLLAPTAADAARRHCPRASPRLTSRAFPSP